MPDWHLAAYQPFRLEQAILVQAGYSQQGLCRIHDLDPFDRPRGMRNALFFQRESLSLPKAAGLRKRQCDGRQV